MTFIILVKLLTYYSQNYASIIGSGLHMLAILIIFQCFEMSVNHVITGDLKCIKQISAVSA